MRAWGRSALAYCGHAPSSADPADVFTRLGGAASLVGDSEGAQREEWDGQEPLVAGLEEATMEEPDEDGWGEDVVL